MKNYTLHRSMGYCPINISGENIISAIENNFKTIAEDANIGNSAGYKLINVTASYNKGILGGKGGCVVKITAIGQPLAHTNDTGDPKSAVVWIGGVLPEELTEEYKFDLK